MGYSSAKQFERLTNNQKKIAIAKDVIEQIHANSILPQCGNYGCVVGTKCYACALGSMFASLIGRATSYPSRQAVTSKLPMFTSSELADIENAFECFQIFSDSSTARTKASIRFGKDHKDPTDRLLAIMQNIVDHGEFNPYCRYVVS